MIKVPYNYLPMQFSNPEPFIEDWRELIKTADFTLGTYVKKFEDQFAEYVGAKYCIATNNGTDALILSLKALGIGVGDEVITVCNSFYATTGAIVAVGATPVFVDCDHRYQIDINAVASAISPRTKAILPVHWAGASPNMPKIIEIAKKYSLKVININNFDQYGLNINNVNNEIETIKFLSGYIGNNKYELRQGVQYVVKYINDFDEVINGIRYKFIVI